MLFHQKQTTCNCFGFYVCLTHNCVFSLPNRKYSEQKSYCCLPKTCNQTPQNIQLSHFFHLYEQQDFFLNNITPLQYLVTLTLIRLYQWSPTTGHRHRSVRQLVLSRTEIINNKFLLSPCERCCILKNLILF